MGRSGSEKLFRELLTTDLRGGGEERPVGWATPGLAAEKGTGPGPLHSHVLPDNQEGRRGLGASSPGF